MFSADGNVRQSENGPTKSTPLMACINVQPGTQTSAVLLLSSSLAMLVRRSPCHALSVVASTLPDGDTPSPNKVLPNFAAQKL
jgi:hypothetical protein